MAKTAYPKLKYVKIELFELESLITEKHSKLEGMLTHAWILPDDSIRYIFQPRGENPEEGGPVKGMLLDPTQVPEDTPKKGYEVPKELLNRVCVDRGSGIKGTVTILDLHLDGCVHAAIQPSGTVAKTGDPHNQHHFDLRRLDYEDGSRVIPKEERKEVAEKPVQERPSPSKSVIRDLK